MAAKTWEQDSRFPAIQASIRLLKGRTDEDPFEISTSWCIPIAKKPVVGLSPGKVGLLILLLGFVLMGCGAFLISHAEKNGNDLLLGLGIVSALSGFACFFVPAKADRIIITWLIGERAQGLRERAGLTRLLSSELSNSDPKGLTVSIEGDDHVLIFPDRAGRRLLIEGTGARYQIRAEAVLDLRPFEFMSYVGADISCTFGASAPLRFGLPRTSILREVINQVPILFFLKDRVRNPLLQACRDCLSKE